MDKEGLSRKVWQNPVYFVAFGFGSGLLPYVPGTWGTLAAMPLYLIVAQSSWLVYFIVTCLAFALGIFVCEQVTKELGIPDYSGIVWDEVVGYLLTMFLAPPGIVWMVVGFVLFRIFDIWKPQPIGFVDKHIHGGLGIMLDDVLAAVPSWVVMQLLIFQFSSKSVFF